MFNTKTSISKLQESSKNALGAFNKIVTDLTNNNAQIETETKTRTQAIEVLEQELEVLDGIKTQNSKVINKINKFLQDED